MSNAPVVFFVLNGLQNGEDGISAHDCSGLMLADGWYFTDEESRIYPDAYGPYYSRDLAVKAADTTTAIDILEEGYTGVQDALAALKRGDKEGASNALTDLIDTINDALKAIG